MKWFALLADEVISNISSYINVKQSAQKEVNGSLQAEAGKIIPPTYFKRGIRKQLNVMLE